jgi:hypothetical protein
MGGWRRWAGALAVVWLAGPTAAWAARAAHYDMKARFDAPAGRVSATVVVTLPDTTGETAFVLGQRFRIDKVEAGPGGQVAITAVDKPIPHLQRIAVRYGGKPASHRVAVTYSGPVNEPGDDVLALSPQRVELDLETMWLPVRQDLAMEFTIDAQFSGLPADLVVISQGDLDRKGDTLRIHRTTLDTDLLVDGAVGLKLVKGPDVDFYAAEQDDPLVATLRKYAFGAAAYYRGLYGPPAPGPVRMVIVPRGNGAGYARRSFVVMPTFRKPGDPTPKFDQASPARFVSHEFRHAWTIAPDTVYSNYWMSESVAEYFGMRYVEATLGLAERNAMLERKRPALATGGPLIGVDKKPTTAALYQKGTVLLFDLEAKIGRPAMDRILVRPDAPTTTPDFLKDLAEVAGPDVAKDFEAKLK